MIQADLRTARQHPDYGMNGLILAAIVIVAVAALCAMLHVLDGLIFMHRAANPFVRFISAWDIAVVFLGYLTCAAGLTRHRAFPWLYLAMAIAFVVPRLLLELQDLGVNLGLEGLLVGDSLMQELYLLRGIAVVICVAAVYVILSPAVRITYRQRLTRDEFRLIEHLQGASPRLSVGLRQEPQVPTPAPGWIQPDIAADTPLLRRRQGAPAAADAAGHPSLPGFLQAPTLSDAIVADAQTAPDAAGQAQDDRIQNDEFRDGRAAAGARSAATGSAATGSPGVPIANNPIGDSQVADARPASTQAANALAANTLAASTLAAETLARAQKRGPDRASMAGGGRTVAVAEADLAPRSSASAPSAPAPSDPDQPVPLPPVVAQTSSTASSSSASSSAAAAAIIAGAQRKLELESWGTSASSDAMAPSSGVSELTEPSEPPLRRRRQGEPRPAALQDSALSPGGEHAAQVQAQPAPQPQQEPRLQSQPVPQPTEGAPGAAAVQPSPEQPDAAVDEAVRQQLDATAARARLQEELEIDRRISRLRGLASGDVSALSLGLTMDRRPSADEDMEEGGAGEGMVGGAPRSTTDERLGRLRAAASVPRMRTDSIRRRQEQDLSESLPSVVRTLATGQSDAEAGTRSRSSGRDEPITGMALGAGGNFQSRIDALLSRVEASNAWHGGSLPSEETALSSPESQGTPDNQAVSNSQEASDGAVPPMQSAAEAQAQAQAQPPATVAAPEAEPLPLPPASRPPHLEVARSPLPAQDLEALAAGIPGLAVAAAEHSPADRSYSAGSEPAPVPVPVPVPSPSGPVPQQDVQPQRGRETGVDLDAVAAAAFAADTPPGLAPEASPEAPPERERAAAPESDAGPAHEAGPEPVKKASPESGVGPGSDVDPEPDTGPEPESGSAVAPTDSQPPTAVTATTGILPAVEVEPVQSASGASTGAAGNAGEGEAAPGTVSSPPQAGPSAGGSSDGGEDPQVEQRIDAMRILVDAGFLSQEEFERRVQALREGAG